MFKVTNFVTCAFYPPPPAKKQGKNPQMVRVGGRFGALIIFFVPGNVCVPATGYTNARLVYVPLPVIHL